MNEAPSMRHDPVGPPFALSLVFPDVEPKILADEERESRAAVKAEPWQAYLRHVLPPRAGEPQ